MEFIFVLYGMCNIYLVDVDINMLIKIIFNALENLNKYAQRFRYQNNNI